MRIVTFAEALCHDILIFPEKISAMANMAKERVESYSFTFVRDLLCCERNSGGARKIVAH